MIYKLLHFSDSHQEKNSENTILTMLNSLPSNESIIPVYTGDFALFKINDGHNSDICNKTLYVLGNHDRENHNPGTPIVVSSSKEVSATYFSDTYVTKNATMGNVPNPTYWSFQKDDIRILGLDCTITDSTELRNELNWLSEQLSDARSNNQKVITMSHMIARGKKYRKCTFTNTYFMTQTNYYTLAGDIASSYFAYCINSLDSILKTNADVIAFSIYGHEHSDVYFDSNGYPEIVIGTSWTSDNVIYNNVARSKAANAKDNLLCNEYIYDTESNYLEIYRIGADRCFDGTRRIMMCIDLSRNAIVSDCSSI